MKRLLGQVGVRVLARVLAAGCQAIMLVYIARELGPSLFGEYAWVSSITILCGALLGLGINSVALRVARYNGRLPTNALMMVGMMAALVSGSAAFSIALFISGDNTWLISLAAATFVVGDIASEVAISIVSGLGHIAAASWFIVARRALMMALVVVLAQWWSLTPALICAGALNLAVPFFYMLASPWPSMHDVRWVVREGGKYWGASLAAQITSLDVSILRATLGSSSAGLYGAAVRVVSPLNIFSSSLIGVFVPFLAREAVDDARSSARHLRWLGAAVGLLLCAGSPLVSWAAVAVLGQDFGGAGPMALALTCAIGISCLSQVLQTELLVAGRPSSVAWSVGVGATVGMCSLAVLCHLFGQAAVGPTVMATQIIILCLLANSIRLEGMRTNARDRLAVTGEE